MSLLLKGSYEQELLFVAIHGCPPPAAAKFAGLAVN
jgi:hypothetical protein